MRPNNTTIAPSCSIPQCDEPYYRWTHCRNHQGLTDAERFWLRVQFSDHCWDWLGGKNTFGYGRFTVKWKNYGAHRWAYEFCGKVIPSGLGLDHLCHNKACVNPDHLEPVTQQVNLRRAMAHSQREGFYSRYERKGRRLTG